MKYFMLFLLGIISSLGSAQNRKPASEQFVVLQNNDTLRGRSVRYGWGDNGGVKHKTDSKTQKFPFSEVKAYHNSLSLVMVHERKTKKGKIYYEEYEVAMMGKVRYMYDEIGRVVLYFEDGRFVDGTENNWLNYIIPEFMKCTEYNWKYESVSTEELRKWIKRDNKMREIVLFYNQNCN